MWTGYKKHGNYWASQVTVIDALMFNIGSRTEGAAFMNILEQDVNGAKSTVCLPFHSSHSSHFSIPLTSHERQMFSEGSWPADHRWKASGDYTPTHIYIYNKIRDVAFVSQYVLLDDTREKAQNIMKSLLRTLYV